MADCYQSIPFWMLEGWKEGTGHFRCPHVLCSGGRLLVGGESCVSADAVDAQLLKGRRSAFGELLFYAALHIADVDK